ncbi:protein translocase subunit SecD [Candidatus Shapirobacteria bacterium]|nr:protein translocase subunit SecD [Candidatus Shapirobacteria bacterium]
MSSVNSRSRNIFLTILGITFLCLIINLPSSQKVSIHWGKINWDHTFYRPDFSFKLGNFQFKKNLDLRYGLDLAGGASLLYDIDTTKVPSGDVASALESLKGNIERRVNLFGISEANVKLTNNSGKNRLEVELPGVEDINQAINLIGRTAQLSFRGEDTKITDATTSATFAQAFPNDTGINGGHLVKSTVQINPNDSRPEVGLEFNAEGTKLFEKATKEYLNKRIAIFLDDVPVTYPTVQNVIPDGKAVINGQFDIKSAKELSAQLNAGALPLPISILSQTTIGATLGKDTIHKGIIAGIIGLVVLSIFMIGNYGFSGLISVISLFIYGLTTLTIYRLVPITLTFPGIVGFILSIGMAVDGNILIFERFKEEIRAGKPWNVAMELGFGKAWDSIKDANTCTIITGLILFNPFSWSFLNTSGMVRGFALTLILGIFISIFTGVFITRNLLRVLASKKNN